jgi:uncharacterized membrane protein
MSKTIETTLTQNIFRILLAFYGLCWIQSPYFRVDFQAQVPDWLPLSKDLVYQVSVEIALGLGLAFGKGTSNIWLDTGTIFVLVFPGNIAQYLDHKMLWR